MSYSSPEDPIGLFDSGVGGLTIFREIAKMLPNEHLIYLGDTARLPYGDKSKETVVRYSLQNAQFLIRKKIKLLVVACFTASSHALEILKEQMPIPVFGMMQSGLEEIASLKGSERIAILGTAGTIQSGILQSLIQTRFSNATIFPVACPLFVPLIEEGLLDHPATQLIARHYLLPLKKEKINTALLACTHYPLVRPAIQEVLGPQVHLIEPAERCSIAVRDWLTSHRLLNPQAICGDHQFYTTDKPDKFRHLTTLFLGSDIQTIAKTEIF